MKLTHKLSLLILSLFYLAIVFFITTSLLTESGGLDIRYDFDTNPIGLIFYRIILGYLPIGVIVVNSFRSLTKKKPIYPYAIFLPALYWILAVGFIIFEIIMCNIINQGLCKESGSGLIILFIPLLMVFALLFSLLAYVIVQLQNKLS